MIRAAKQRKPNNTPPSLSKDSLNASRKVIKDQINKYHGQFFDRVKDLEKKSNSDLNLATSNSKLIVENTEGISNEQFDYQSLIKWIETLENKTKELTDELEESNNKSMRKTLVFKNTKQPQQRESWDQTKQILVN